MRLGLLAPLFAAALSTCALNPAFPQSQGGPATATGYPPNSVAASASATGTTTGETATISHSATAARLTYVCGALFSAAAGTAGGNATITGLVGGTLNFALGVGTVNVPVSFSPCMPATATSQDVAAVEPTMAGTTFTAVSLWGYQLAQ